MAVTGGMKTLLAPLLPKLDSESDRNDDSGVKCSPAEGAALVTVVFAVLFHCAATCACSVACHLSRSSSCARSSSASWWSSSGHPTTLLDSDEESRPELRSDTVDAKLECSEPPPDNRE